LIADPASTYTTNDALDFRETDAPTHVSQINKLDNQNKKFPFNVFSWDKGESFTGSASSMKRSHLPFRSSRKGYTRVKYLNRLLFDKSTYSREALLEAHKPECRGIGHTTVRVEMPKEGKNKLTFQK